MIIYDITSLAEGSLVVYQCQLGGQNILDGTVLKFSHPYNIESSHSFHTDVKFGGTFMQRHMLGANKPAILPTILCLA